MTIKELLLQEINSSDDLLLEETLNFLRFLKTKLASTQPEANKSTYFTVANILEYVKTSGTWAGEDFEECFEIVDTTCLKQQ